MGICWDLKGKGTLRSPKSSPYTPPAEGLFQMYTLPDCSAPDLHKALR